MKNDIKQPDKKKSKDTAGGVSRRDRSAVEKIAADWKDGMPASLIAKRWCIDIDLVQWTIRQLETQGVRTIQR